MFDICSINFSAQDNTIFELFLCTRQLSLIHVGYGLINSLSKGMWYTLKTYGVRFGDLVAQACVLPILSISSATETPFSFDSDRRASRGWYVTTNVANENVINFLALFKLIPVFICNPIQNTLISYHINQYNTITLYFLLLNFNKY
jgi:hypothetical protein